MLLRSAKTTAIVLLLVATCTGLSWIMSYENIPQTVSAALLSISDNPVVILILINVILLIVRIFMDMTPAVLIFTPIFLPIATGAIGDGPVHFRDHDGIEPLCGIMYATGGFGIVYRM